MALLFCFWVSFSFLLSFSGLIFSQHDGFFSLSCGATTTFVDPLNITWTPDDQFITTGNTTTITYNQPSSSSKVSARFFSDLKHRNCYKLPTRNASSAVLVRAQFIYKNYDGLERPPVFSVSLGRAVMSTINLTKADPWTEEFVWPVSNEVLSVCFQSIRNGGRPVISFLEVRKLPQGSYDNGVGESWKKALRKSYRINCGYTNGSVRYPSDPYDRTWDADEDFTPFHTSKTFSTQSILNASSLTQNPPMAVLQTARLLERKNVLTYDFRLEKPGDYYIVLYFAGILPVSSSFNVLINGDIVESRYVVRRWEVSALFFTKEGISRLSIAFENVSFYPQINAIEVYKIVDIPSETSSTTVSALEVIQQYTGLDLGWEDDPCFPAPWNHIRCEGNAVTSLELSDINLRSISPAFGDLLDLKTLDLHNTSLDGEIQNLASLLHLQILNLSFNQLTSFGTDLDSLISLKILDLKNNSLQGLVPDSLGALKHLHLLNVEENNLQGPLPQSLNKDSLVIRTSGNSCLSFSTSTSCDGYGDPSMQTPEVTTVPPDKKQTSLKRVAIVLSSIGGCLCAFVLVSLMVFLYAKWKKTRLSDPERVATEIPNWNFAAKVFSYREIKAATSNFKEAIGRGSFGSVYLGKLPDAKMVAVKVRFDNTQLGHDSFINEVCLLSQIRHQNLVSLEGFCHDSKRQILVYEYLPGGSLADSLYGTNSRKITLSWVRRLKIAVDAAKGLEYLHSGREPRIIHRDVKCSNILLDSHMNAKVCDFGLSKQLARADASHVTTVVKGTAGYLDPEYYSTQQLTEKSDVYSFGVVLLELICGREPLVHSGTPDTFNLVLWAKPYLQAGAYEIVDDTIRGTYDAESMRKVASLASRCVERDAALRPTISEVLEHLKDAYSLQLAYLASIGYAS